MALILACQNWENSLDDGMPKSVYIMKMLLTLVCQKVETIAITLTLTWQNVDHITKALTELCPKFWYHERGLETGMLKMTSTLVYQNGWYHEKKVDTGMPKYLISLEEPWHLHAKKLISCQRPWLWHAKIVHIMKRAWHWHKNGWYHDKGLNTGMPKCLISW